MLSPQKVLGSKPQRKLASVRKVAWWTLLQNVGEDAGPSFRIEGKRLNAEPGSFL